MAKSSSEGRRVTLTQITEEDLPGSLEASKDVTFSQVPPVQKVSVGQSADQAFYKGATDDMSKALVRLTDAVTFGLWFSPASSFALLLINAILIPAIHGTPISDTVIMAYFAATSLTTVAAKIFDTFGGKDKN